MIGTSYVVKGIREMKLSLECSIKGKVKIGRQLKVINGLKEYLLIPDDKGWLSSIKLIKKVKCTKHSFLSVSKKSMKYLLSPVKN